VTRAANKSGVAGHEPSGGDAAARKASHAERVLALLKACGTPRTAYQILDDLRDDGINAPTTVYRALDRLVATKAVHRIETTNAYVACRRESCRGPSVLAVCDGCGAVTEQSSEEMGFDLGALLRRADFDPATATIEIRGRCGACRAG
jgi:Fur family zinc uptake transcriptional regulator